MKEIMQAEAIRGRKINLTWIGGPTEGETHLHHFHEDGTVEWQSPAASTKSPKEDRQAPERPEYGAVQVADDVYLISYLAPSGYTLTVALNFKDYTVVGFASGAKEWHAVSGKFEMVE